MFLSSSASSSFWSSVSSSLSSSASSSFSSAIFCSATYQSLQPPHHSLYLHHESLQPPHHSLTSSSLTLSFSFFFSHFSSCSFNFPTCLRFFLNFSYISYVIVFKNRRIITVTTTATTMHRIYITASISLNCVVDT